MFNKINRLQEVKNMVFSKELQKSADNNKRDAGNNIILDGWYCPVCDY